MHQYLQGAGADVPEHMNELNKVFDVELPFYGVVTLHERKKFIKENFRYIVSLVYNFTYVFFFKYYECTIVGDFC